MTLSQTSYIRQSTQFGDHRVQDVTKLKPADHLYVYMLGIKSGFRHHGIVYEVPEGITTENEAYERIKVVHFNSSKSIHLDSLHVFCYEQKRTPRYVVYDVPWFYWKFSYPGTCHKEPKLPSEIILNHCKVLIEQLSSEAIGNNHILKYNLLTTNCEDFALWCTLGVISELFSPQVQLVLKLSLKTFKKAAKNAHHIHHLIKLAKSGVSPKQLAKGVVDGCKNVVHHLAKHGGNVGTQTATQTAAAVAGDAVSHVLNFSAAGTVVGINVGVEAAITAGRVLRYQNDITYTQRDLKVDVAKGGSTALVVGAASGTVILLASNPVGWAIAGAAGAGLAGAFVCWGVWKIWKRFYGKTSTEKMILEFSGYFNKKKDIKKIEFNNKEDFKDKNKLQQLHSNLKKIIKIYKLHPNTWSPQMIEEMENRQEKLEGNFWARFFDKFACTSKPWKWNLSKKNVIHEKLISCKTKEQKLKAYFVLFAVMEKINEDIQKIDGNNDISNNDNNNYQPLAIEHVQNQQN